MKIISMIQIVLLLLNINKNDSKTVDDDDVETIIKTLNIDYNKTGNNNQFPSIFTLKLDSNGNHFIVDFEIINEASQHYPIDNADIYTLNSTTGKISKHEIESNLKPSFQEFHFYKQKNGNSIATLIKNDNSTGNDSPFRMIATVYNDTAIYDIMPVVQEEEEEEYFNQTVRAKRSIETLIKYTLFNHVVRRRKLNNKLNKINDDIEEAIKGEVEKNVQRKLIMQDLEATSTTTTTTPPSKQVFEFNNKRRKNKNKIKNGNTKSLSINLNENDNKKTIGVFIKKKSSMEPVKLYVKLLVVTDPTVFYDHQRFAQTTNTDLVFLHMKIYFAHLINSVNQRFLQSFRNDPDLNLTIKLQNFLFLTVTITTFRYYSLN
jgi:hypothetical protein